MLKKYSELSDELKEEAREIHPLEFNDYLYKTQGVEIAWSCK